MMGPAAVGEATSQMSALLDLVSNPDKYQAQVDQLKQLADAAKQAQAVNQETLDKIQVEQERVNADRMAAEVAQSAANTTLENVKTVREAANKTLAEAQALRHEVDWRSADLAKSEVAYEENLIVFAKHQAAIAKREQELTILESTLSAKSKDYDAKLAKLKEITG